MKRMIIVIVANLLWSLFTLILTGVGVLGSVEPVARGEMSWWLPAIVVAMGLYLMAHPPFRRFFSL